MTRQQPEQPPHNSGMSAKQAQARIKINHLLESAGWRFFDSIAGKANIALEPNVKLSQNQIDALGNDFEPSSNGNWHYSWDLNQGKLIPRMEAKIKTAVDRVRGYMILLPLRAVAYAQPIGLMVWRIRLFRSAS